MTDPNGLTPATERLQTLLDGVTEQALGRPTPCGYDVATLVDHVSGLALAFRLAAEKSDDPLLAAPPTPSGNDLDPQWRTLVRRRLDELAEAWRDPAAWTGTTRAGGVELPGEIAGLVALQELVIHGWDLARATDQSYDPDPVGLGIVHAIVLESAEPGREDEREGLFGPVVPVDAAAPLLDRVIGLSGRSPAWPH